MIRHSRGAKNRFTVFHSRSGSTLVVVLVMSLVLTVTGVYSFRSVLFQSRMVHRSYHHQQALALAEAGVELAILELEVLRTCKKFAKEADERTLQSRSERGIPTYTGVSASANQVIYGEASEGEPLRELDCLVTLYDEIELDGPFNMQLVVNAPIACKQRKGVEVFGVTDPELSLGSIDFPIVSDLAGSVLFRSLTEVPTDWPAAVHSTTLLTIAHSFPSSSASV